MLESKFDINTIFIFRTKYCHTGTTKKLCHASVIIIERISSIFEKNYFS